MPYKETYPSALLADAVEAISSLPGVGRRSALRLALHLLKQPAENVHHFTGAIDANYAHFIGVLKMKATIFIKWLSAKM